MTIAYKIWDFPTVPIQKQLFHVPGAAVEGGFTSGGARITSPEPGGRSILETQVALQVQEWDFPFSSWIMSKTNGQIFRVPLTKTPQLVSNAALTGVDGPSNLAIAWEPTGLLVQGQWDNDQYWSDDGIYAETVATASEGTLIVKINMLPYGPILKHGHVFGIRDATYKVDDIEYDDGNVATVTVVPPLRNNILVGDMVLFRPYFLGTISNGSEVKATYDAENVGHMQMGKILFSEVYL